MQRRDRSYLQSLGKPLLKKVKESRVLLVGAGGIGCEVLKNLVCCGFGSFTVPEPHAAKEAEAENGKVEDTGQRDAAPSTQSKPQRKHGIVVVDLDTIDLSNLNRQFLFRKQHIKKPKAQVAKETASRFNPSVNIEAHHASIFDAKYNVDFFASFDVVFNALDNLAARRHVNRMCLAADVPLIESGTTGFNGQVQAIQKGVTECYDCNPKPVQKSFPICTIRSTPSQPIHCIVWAKSYLFPELFGTSEDDSTDMTVTTEDNADEVAKLKEEAEAPKKIRSMMGKSEFAQEVFNKVFHDDIERLRSLTEMWQTRKPPESLHFEANTLASSVIKQGQTLSAQDQKPWTLLENISVFCSSLDALSHRALGGEKVIEFDKDDTDTLDFVAAAANLRSHIFGISSHSKWEIKQMAGNIIPAIATSNALTASLCVFEAFKILRSQISHLHDLSANHHGHHATVNGKDEALLGGSKMVFLTSKNTERMVTTQALQPPNPQCPVCSPVYARLTLPKDGEQTLQDVVDLLKTRIGYEEFSITTDAGIIYDPDLDDNLGKPLGELGIDGQSNGFLTVMDDGDEPKVELVLSATVRGEAVEGEDADTLQLLPRTLELPLKPAKATTNGEVNGDADAVVEESAPGTNNKRKREAEGEVESVKKKVKADDEEEVFVVEDDGAILLDDD